jgi:hypothetical protein
MATVLGLLLKNTLRQSYTSCLAILFVHDTLVLGHIGLGRSVATGMP